MTVLGIDISIAYLGMFVSRNNTENVCMNVDYIRVFSAIKDTIGK